MLRIRLRRTGRAKQPSYRVVVADQRAPRDGAFVETLGHYNPRTDPTTFEVDEERVKHWLAQGAQPSETLHRLFHQRGLIDEAPPRHATHPSKAEARAEAEAATAEAEAEAKAEADAEAAKAEAEAATASASESESESEDGDAGSSEGSESSESSDASEGAEDAGDSDSSEATEDADGSEPSQPSS